MAQVIDISKLESRISVLENQVIRGTEAAQELPALKSKLEALMADPEYREKLQAKAQKLADRAAKLAQYASKI